MNVKIYIMATHGKFLFNLTVKGIRNGNDLELGVYGLFNTEKVHWTYYMISYYKNSKGDLLITSSISGVAVSAGGDARAGTIIGKALENYDSDHIGTIEVAVGRA